MKLTNIKSVLNTAEERKEEGSRKVINFNTGHQINGLYVRYQEGYDYLIFENSSSQPYTEFSTKYEAIDWKVDVNPLNSKMSLHIRIESNLRKKLSEFYEDLCLSYDYNNTDDSVWGVVESWAHLWSRIKLDKLSNEEIIGLVGELIGF